MTTPTFSEWMAGEPIVVVYAVGEVTYQYRSNGITISFGGDVQLTESQVERLKALIRKPTRLIYDLILRSMQ